MFKRARKRPTTDQSSGDVLERLHHLHPKIIDLSLDRILVLLERLGRPQDHLPPTIHVAGTNGKGSVIAFMRAILETAGHRVHVYTSPHLVRYNERIRLAGTEITESELAAVLTECERVNKGDSITYFEITTAAALLAFSRSEADVLLLETGLGGRFDATNVIDRPAATVITPVSMDHMHFLGDTIRRIAAEKGAIQKPGVPSIIAPQYEQAKAVLLQQAEAANARPFLYGRDWAVEPTADGMCYRSSQITLDLPQPGLVGRHQLINAGTAVACLEQFWALEIPDTAIAEGLPAAQWPARLQRLDAGRMAAIMPDGWEIWLDGGHNPAAGEALAETLRAWDDKPLYLIFGMMQRKTPQHFLRPMTELVSALRAVAIDGQEGSFTAAEAADAATEVDIRSTPAPSVESALADIVATEKGPARILICGSLFLAGSVLAQDQMKDESSEDRRAVL
jgi:dihydrofolate synthase/folylpolyglutamate synthase